MISQMFKASILYRVEANIAVHGALRAPARSGSWHFVGTSLIDTQADQQ